MFLVLKVKISTKSVWICCTAADKVYFWSRLPCIYIYLELVWVNLHLLNFCLGQLTFTWHWSGSTFIYSAEELCLFDFTYTQLLSRSTLTSVLVQANLHLPEIDLGHPVLVLVIAYLHNCILIQKNICEIRLVLIIVFFCLPHTLLTLKKLTSNKELNCSGPISFMHDLI